MPSQPWPEQALNLELRPGADAQPDRTGGSDADQRHDDLLEIVLRDEVPPNHLVDLPQFRRGHFCDNLLSPMLARPFGDPGNGLGATATEHYPHDEGPAALDLVKRNPVDLGERKGEKGGHLERRQNFTAREG